MDSSNDAFVGGLVVALGIVCIVIGLVILGLMVWLPYYIANKRGLNWQPVMLVVSLLLMLFFPFIGWLGLLFVALLKEPPATQVIVEGPNGELQSVPVKQAYAPNFAYVPSYPPPFSGAASSVPPPVASVPTRYCAQCGTAAQSVEAVYCGRCGQKLPSLPG